MVRPQSRLCQGISMRAEIKAMAEEIQQSLELLRRSL
jgi:hypothetical protein